MSDEHARELGAHGEAIKNLQKQVSQMDTKLDGIIETLNRAKGGWTVGLMACGAAGAVGGLAVKLLPFVALVR